MRGKTAGALALVLFLVLLMAPVTFLMDRNRADGSGQDAQHLIEPMIRLAGESPVQTAQTAVEPVMDIEDAWEIEDTRTESFEPLVAGMRNGGDEMGYDAQSRTFYCTVGMEETGDWPQVALFAQGAADDHGETDETLRVAWIDDYAYDFKSDAVACGYRYELLAYTDTAFEYFGIVFTGLPIVTVHTETEIGETYVPARVSVSGGGFDAVQAGALVHTRGGGYQKSIDKQSFRVEFHEQTSGRDKKRDLSLLGMEEDSDWLLIANASDETGMRNHLCWDLWKMWNPDGHAPALLESRMVEVFVGDEYVGLYQLMQRIREEEEMVRMGGDPQTDYLYRIIREIGIDTRPVTELDLRFYEVRRKPESVSEARQFDRIQNYYLLNMTVPAMEADAFTALARQCVDIPALMNYYAFSQAADLGYENVDNNVYIWALRNEDGHYVYHLSPWDMDNALPMNPEDGQETESLNLMMHLPFELLNLDVDGCRDLYWEIWMDKRRTILTEDAIYQWLDTWEYDINRSGAYARETEKWWGGAKELSLQTLCANMIATMNSMERQMRELWPTEEYKPE